MIYRLEVKPFADKQIVLVETFADQAAIVRTDPAFLDGDPGVTALARLTGARTLLQLHHLAEFGRLAGLALADDFRLR